MIQVRLQGMKPDQVRVIIATLYHSREEIPPYYYGSGSIARHWEPTIGLEGPECYTITTPHIPLPIMGAIAKALQELGT